MNKSVLISSFIFIIIAITNAQFNKEDLKSSTQSSFFSMLKSLAIEYLNDNSEIGHMLLHHAEKCPFYCLNDGKYFFFLSKCAQCKTQARISDLL